MACPPPCRRDDRLADRTAVPQHALSGGECSTTSPSRWLPSPWRKPTTSSRGFAVLRGARGREPADLAALSHLVRAVGDLLAAAPEISELDLNPVLCGRDGCVAADWRIVVQNRPSQDEECAEDSP
ncbi:acetate--CoA ligase family protein [Carbonactinospora thermoautotrophica]|uniref:acetate--CoA ligase family protein n=1 Tax=Carbonactinospora thermoautotrophica TaxID=1469144 RepID=UPI00099F2ECC|nr:acetate--CoA ligase family protein [Carbonactinospora thermoautotrophica]